MNESGKLPEHKIAYRVLRAVGTLVVKRPGWVIAVYVLLAVVAIRESLLRLELRTGQNELISGDLTYNQRYLEMLEQFGDLEFLHVIILVEDDPERAAALAAAIAAEVGALSEHVEEVRYRVPPDELRDLAFINPQISASVVRDVAGALTGAREALARLGEVDSFEGLFAFFDSLFDPTFALEHRTFAAGGGHVVEALLDGLTAVLGGREPRALERTLEATFVPEEPHPRERGYYFSDNGEIAFIEIMPRKNYTTLEVIREPLAAIRGALERVRERSEFQGMRFGLTGRPVLQADEMQTTNRDMVRATILALVAVVALFVACFRRLRRPMLAALTLVIAIVLTFGLVTVTIGYLTIFSIVFAAMLVGLGIDFGIHVLARYQDELLRTDDIELATRETLLSTGVGVWTGGVTTAVAFFATVMVDFKGLRELGFVAGCGVLICLVAMLTLFPALLVVSDRFLRRRRTLHPPKPVRLPLFRPALRAPVVVLAALTALSLAGLIRLRDGVPYDYNLLNLQARGLESVEFEQLYLERSSRSTWYASFVTGSLDGVDDVVARLEPARAAGIVGAVESARDFIAPDLAQRAEILEPAREVVAAARIAPPAAAVNRAALAQAARTFQRRLASLESGARVLGGEAAALELAALGERLAEFIAALEGAGDEATAALAAYQQTWFAELAALRASLEDMLEISGLPARNLPEALRRRYVSLDGDRYLVYAYPARDIWQEEHMREFVAAVRVVDEAVTGTPIQVFESAKLMREGFLRAAAYSLIAVFVLIVLDLRSFWQSVLVVAPLGFGLLWLLESMTLLGLSFNLANFFSLPILIGAGVDGGVHVLHRFRETGSTRDVLATTGSAVALSFLTTIFGFGALALAHHRGVASLGYVMALGCVLILISTTVLLPALLVLIERRRR